MALIQCTECGNNVSSKAEKCPHCGCPISEMISEGFVSIKLPNTQQFAQGWAGILSSKEAEIYDDDDNVLWEGKHGETAKFKINQPTYIYISLGNWANEVEGIIEPRKKYTLVQDYGFHWLATFRLTEVDIIDTD